MQCQRDHIAWVNLSAAQSGALRLSTSWVLGHHSIDGHRHWNFQVYQALSASCLLTKLIKATYQQQFINLYLHDGNNSGFVGVLLQLKTSRKLLINYSQTKFPFLQSQCQLCVNALSFIILLYLVKWLLLFHEGVFFSLKKIRTIFKEQPAYQFS